MYEDIRFTYAGRFISRGDWIHPRRTINTHELIFVLDGPVHISVGTEVYCLQPGDMLHIAPGVPHGGTQVSSQQVSFYWVHFTGEASALPPFLRQSEPSRTEILCKQLLHCATAPGYPSDCADCFVRILLMELSVQHSACATPNVLCAAVEEWIRGNTDRPIRVSDVAAYFGFNPDYLNRVFRRYHPEGLKAYIDAIRCQRIRKDLSTTDLTLQQIAQKYGFRDYKYFLKYFRFHEGVTPTEFRNAYYKTHINWV